ncbi:MAG: tetratricopeptide repeat protein [bacterium]|nr:tetratricopeptide repeat protein [bacterium]
MKDGAKKSAVILFADIVGCSEMSNNLPIEEYAKIIEQFHRCGNEVYELLGLHNYNDDEVIEIEARGDEICLILHRGINEEDTVKDIRDVLLFAIYLKCLWRVSEYNKNRLKNGLAPRDVAIGINQGVVYFYSTAVKHMRKTPKVSEGYAINLTKRIEAVSRSGKESKIFVSDTIYYYVEKSKELEFVRLKEFPVGEIKGITTIPNLWECTKIKTDSLPLRDKIELSNEEWEQYKHLVTKDFWRDVLIELTSKGEEKNKIEPRKTLKGADKETQNKYDEAYKNYITGNYGKAIELLTGIIKINSNFAEIFYNRGFAYAKKEEPDKAIQDYDKAISIDPTYVEAFNNRGVAYYHKGDLNKAIQDYDKAISIDATYARAFYNRGLAYDNKGDFDKAIKDFEKAISVDANYAEAFNNRGGTYAKKGDLDKAIKDFDKAISINPNFADAFYNRGFAYDDKGELDKAIQDYDKAISINPNYAKAFYNHGVAYAKKGDLDKAMQDYDKAISIDANYADAFYNKGCVYSLKGDKENALKYLSRAIELDGTKKKEAKEDNDFEELWKDGEFKRVVG